MLRTCCGCWSLKTGTIFSGVCGIIFSVIDLILIFTANIKFKIIIIESLDKTIVQIILAINLVMTILISIFLIIGAIKRNVFFMLPWVILGLMCAIALLVSLVYTSIMFYVNHDVLNGTVWLVFGLLAVAIYLYMWTVVYSYFQEVRMTKNDGRMGPYGRPYNYRRY